MSLKLSANFDKLLDNELRKRFENNDLPQAYNTVLAHVPPEITVRGPRVIVETTGRVAIRSVVKAHHRPSLLVQDGTFSPAPSEVWNDLLNEHRGSLEDAIPAVGRINVSNHPEYVWLGTGFLAQKDLLVTNRHVAVEFSDRQGDGFTWRSVDGAEVRASVDLYEEHNRPQRLELEITDILFIADQNGPDLAVLRVDGDRMSPTPLKIEPATSLGTAVAAIGYPWRDSRALGSMEEALARIFGDVYDVKRLAPGKVRNLAPESLDHDCSTLRGNSGSPIVEIETGKVVAVHERGARLNHAVPARHLEKVLAHVG